MEIPPFVGNDPKAYLDHLLRQINRADARWTAYAAALSADYAHAFTAQSGVLTGIKKTLDAKKAFEHDRVTFALSLLTVGVGGALAGFVARSATKDKVWEDAIKDTLKAINKKQTDNLGSVIAPKATVTANPFAPAGVTPTEYWSRMVYGFAKLKTSLQDFQDGLNQQPPFNLHLVLPDLDLLYINPNPLNTTETKLVADEILATRYFADCPEPEYPPGKFLRNVSLALWIGWAYQRDVKYWKLQHDLTNAYYPDNEQVDWDRLRPELLGLGVSAQNITPAYAVPDYFRNRVDGLDMWGFFRWVAGPASRVALFDGLPRNAEGFEQVDKQMNMMQLTETGWVQH
ncbi:MAG: hypothetical protein WCA28_12375 [Bradyrhizobium sp.]